jgi:hypothetical protein
MHYIAFLIERGWAPYRQFGDMNMPGSFLIELAAMHVFGAGDLGARLFDFTLLGAASISFFSLLRPQGASSATASSSWMGRLNACLAGLFASALFVLIHGRDGVAEGAQRDLTMAVLLVAGTACLALTLRPRTASPRVPWLPALAFGLLAGAAVTIKPTALLLPVAQLLAAGWRMRRERRALQVVPAMGGLLLAPAVCAGFLLRERALGAFVATLRTVVPYYAGLGHRPLGFILLHSVSPVLPLVVLWLAVLALRRPPVTPTRALLLLGVVFGLANCVLQQRALPYYRYPLLAFLLPLVALDFTQAVAPSVVTAPREAPTRRSRAAAVVSLVALAFGSLVLAPQSAWMLHRYQYDRLDFLDALQHDLTALGGDALSGRIQCIDTISGCNNALYRMRLEPATGVLSDFLLFGNPPGDPESVPAIRDTRAEFAAAVLAHPPEVIVVSSHLYIEGPEDFGKLTRWPALQSFLTSRYTLATEWHPTRTVRWWSREELPGGYRIYLLRPARPQGESSSSTRAQAGH